MVLPVCSGIFATLLWALFPAFCKIALKDMSVYEFLLLRYVIAFSVVGFLLPRIYKKRLQMPLKSWVLIASLVSVHNTTQGLCLLEVPVSWYILFFSCAPAITYMMMPFRKKPVVYGFFGLAVVGTVIFITPSTVGVTPSPLSLFYLMVSTVSWAALTRVMADFHKIYNDMEISCILNGSNLVTAIGLFLLFSSHGLTEVSVQIQGLLPLFLIGVTSPLAVVLFSKSIRLFPSFGIASQYLELVFGVAIGVIFFAEIPGFYQYVGLFFLVFSLVGITLATYVPPTKSACYTA